MATRTAAVATLVTALAVLVALAIADSDPAGSDASPKMRVTEVESVQVDTTKADAVRQALETGLIEEDQNPCTYPADLREVIELSDDECAGELGRALAEQYD